MYEKKQFPEYSWSLSRHKTFLECNRKYAYHYYMSHNGWLKDSNILAKDAYRLKNLTNLEMFFGKIVHELIEKILKHFLEKNIVPDEEKLNQLIKDQLNQGFWESMNSRELWTMKPKHYTMFHEIYYEGKLMAEKIEEIKYRLNVSMKNFLASQTFQDIQQKDKTKVFEFEQFRTMNWNGTKVFIVMDMVYRDFANNKWIIVDWKTGKASDEDRNQLALYALYLKGKFKLKDLSEIEVRNEYLLEGFHKTYKLTRYDIENIKYIFELSNENMKFLLEDQELNKPLDLGSFEKTIYETKCNRCNYKELCEMY